jgi:thymidine phosphorylase
VLADGRAWKKFAAICEAQGGLREPPEAVQRHEAVSQASGTVVAIDNRRLARLAKLAGAPGNLAAGLTLAVRVGETVVKGQPLFRLHAGSTGEIAYALEYATAAPAITVAG